MKNSPPLTGITVLAIEHAIAAPLCTRQLAELGARVIKVERRLGGDFARHYDSRAGGECSHFVWTNRSKESLTLDLKHEAAQEVIQRLLARADVLVQNLAPNAASRMGLDFDSLHEQFPGLIVCNISGYGEGGPYADKKAYDLLVQAEAGFLTVTGTPSEMAKSGISIADIAAGMQAHSAVLGALIQRSRTGEGSRIDISMLEAMVEWMGFPLYYAYDGQEAPPRSGTDHASIYPYGVFKTGDDQAILIGLQNEREWQAFCCNVLGDSHLQGDPRFSSNEARSVNRLALRTLVQARFERLNHDEVGRLLDSARIAFATVNDMKAVWQHPQLHALDRLASVETEQGALSYLKPPAQNSDFEHKVTAVPALGQHTDQILSEIGFNQTEIQVLRKKQVV